MSDRERERERPSPWQLHKEYRHEDLCVRINVFTGYSPTYSVEVGRLGPDGYLKRHFPAEMLPDVIDLMDRASRDLASLLVAELEHKKQEIAKKEARQARYLQNVERRKEENRKRAASR